jgi:predicted dehydrogenase
LVAVASREQSRAEDYAAEWGIGRALGSYEALLDDPDVDVVYISLPNSLHAEWTVRAARAGKHVLCEKPLAPTVAECDRIIAAAESSGVVVVEAFMYLHHPLLRKAQQLVQEGAVGQVRLVRGAFSFYLGRPHDVRWNPDLSGGSLWDVGCYPVSFIRTIAGEPAQVFGWQKLSKSGVDETFTGLLRYDTGVLGHFDCGFRCQFRTQAEIAGTEGTLSIIQPYAIDEESQILLKQGSREEIFKLPFIDAYRCEVDAVNAAILEGTALPLPLSSSRANVATLTALYESARQGKALSPKYKES